MLMRFLNNDLLNNSLERFFNARFTHAQLPVVYLALFIVLSVYALEKIIAAVGSLWPKTN
ncbi:hypothetical protein ACX8XP_01260 [Calditrichota bacterium LG25]